MIRKIKNNSALFLFCLLLVSCNSLSPDEKREMIRLREKYPNYEISKMNDISDTYIKVKSNENRIDTSKLVEIWQEFDVIKKQKLPNGQPIVEWNLAVVYDFNGDYLFTIGKKNGKVIFFQNGMH